MDGVIARLQLFKLQFQPPQLLLAAVLTGRQNAFHNAGEVRYDRFLIQRHGVHGAPQKIHGDVVPDLPTDTASDGISCAVCAPQALVGGGEAAPAIIGASVLPLFGAVREAFAALTAANFTGERIAVAMSAAACRTVAAGQLPLHRLPRFAVDDGLVVIF